MSRLVHELQGKSAQEATAGVMRLLAWLLEEEPVDRRDEPYDQLLNIARAGAGQVGINPAQARWLLDERLNAERPTRPLPQAAWHAMGYCARAVLAEEEGRDVDAWRALASANFFIGEGIAAMRLSRARAEGGDKKHRDHRDYKADSIDWLDRNAEDGVSQEKLTDALIAARVVRLLCDEDGKGGFKRSTIRSWVREWCKQNRASAQRQREKAAAIEWLNQHGRAYHSKEAWVAALKSLPSPIARWKEPDLLQLVWEWRMQVSLLAD